MWQCSGCEIDSPDCVGKECVMRNQLGGYFDERVRKQHESLLNHDEKNELIEVTTLFCDQEELKYTLKEFIVGTPMKMSNVIRFSGIHQIYNESVAQHCHQVAMLCWLLARIEKLFKKEIDLGRLLTNAIFHDMEEVLGSDLNHHFKKFNAEFKELYEKVSYEYTKSNFYDKLFFRDELSDKICGYKNDTIEGKILAIADMLQLVGKSIIEIDSGNIEFFNPFLTGYKYLKQDKFKEINGLSFVFPYLNEKLEEWKKRFGEKIIERTGH